MHTFGFSHLQNVTALNSSTPHNVVDRGVLKAMWEELAGFGHRDQLIIC